jgi:predicted branched-subunit amino acid permease
MSLIPLPAWVARYVPPLDRDEFAIGARQMLPASIAIASWGLVTGVAMVKSGLSPAMALFMTFTVFAGSAQLATLPLLALGTPLPIVWATALIVNLRFVIFSAGLRPYFAALTLKQRLFGGYLTGDLNYVLFMGRFGNDEAKGTPKQWGYWAGGIATNWTCWQVASVAGIALASVIPQQWGLELAAVLALVAVLIPLSANAPAVLGVLVTGALSIILAGLPMRLGLLVSVLAGVAAAVLIEPVAYRVTAGLKKPGAPQ